MILGGRFGSEDADGDSGSPSLMHTERCKNTSVAVRKVVDMEAIRGEWGSNRLSQGAQAFQAQRSYPLITVEGLFGKAETEKSGL